MASKISGSRKLKKNILPKFEMDVYSKIPPGDLIVFSVHYLIEQKMKVTLEDIISICFRLFPQKFGLKKFPKWPDSALVSRRWSDVRRNGFVASDAELEFRLTSKGSNIIKKVGKILGIMAAPKPVIKKRTPQPKKEKAIPVKETKSPVSAGKTNSPIKKAEKIKGLKPRTPALIQKKIALLFPEEKVTPIAQKASSAQAEKATPPSAPVENILPAKQAKKKLPAPVKQARPIRTKKITTSPPAPVKQLLLPETKIRPAKQAPAVATKQVQAPVPAKQVKKISPRISPPTPTKKVHPIQVKKSTPPTAPVKQVQAPKAKIGLAKQVTKTSSGEKEKTSPPVSIKKIRPVRAKKVTPPPAPVKQVLKPEIKVQHVTQAKKEKVSTPAPIKKIRPVRAKKVTPPPASVKQVQPPEIKVRPAIQAKKTQAVPVSKPAEKAKPIQPSTVIPTGGAKEAGPITPPKIVRPRQARKTKPVEPVIIQQSKAKKTQSQKADSIAPINPTREEKERAGKFTRMMERSDAYIDYKKHGTNSKINEFDFRSLLLCTMESSAETLARNVKLFKGYAGIHNRQDLNTFLIFCEDKFSYLLKPQNKSRQKAKKY